MYVHLILYPCLPVYGPFIRPDPPIQLSDVHNNEPIFVIIYVEQKNYNRWFFTGGHVYVSLFDYEHKFPSCVYSERCDSSTVYCIIYNSISNQSSNMSYMNTRKNLTIIVYPSMQATKCVWGLADNNWIVNCFCKITYGKRIFRTL